MKKRIAIIATSLTLLIAMTASGCEPRKGDDCTHRGDVHAKGGEVLRCTKTPGGGLEWQ